MSDSLEGSGVLGQMGVVPYPIGTLEELKEKNFDPSKVGSCHAPAPGVAGCPHFKSNCIFDNRRNGDFKGKGPRYVGYLEIPDEGPKKEDFCACFTFVATMRNRMYAGEAKRRESGGREGELIKIIAQQGEEIVTRVLVRENEQDRGPNPVYKFETKMIKVPEYPRPGERRDLNYDNLVTERELARQRIEREAEEAAARAARMKLSDPEPKLRERKVRQEEPVSEPVKPK